MWMLLDFNQKRGDMVQECICKVKSLRLPLFKKEDIKRMLYSSFHFLWKLKFVQVIARLFSFLLWAYSW